MKNILSIRGLLTLLCFALLSTPTLAIEQQTDSLVRRSAEVRELAAPTANFSTLAGLSGETLAAVESDLVSLKADMGTAQLDTTTGRWASLYLKTPLIPGDGVGNTLASAGAQSLSEIEAAAKAAFLGWLNANSDALRIDTAELGAVRVAAHDQGRKVQIFAERVVNGINVRNSSLLGVISHGNLVLFGAWNWADINQGGAPTLNQGQADQAMNAYLGDLQNVDSWSKAHLEYVTAEGSPRLAWVFSPTFVGDMGKWEAVVDAENGAMLAFHDTVHYASTRNVTGGVLPASNDGTPPDGVEQAGWPMPFAYVQNGADTYTTSTGGNLPVCLDGTITVAPLEGPFMTMSDVCGAFSESTAGDTLDFGASAGTDCTVPGGGSPGNTHASRSGFYEMGRMKELAMSHLPNNGWLQDQLLATMNINSNCNANWDGFGVNFYTSGGGCGNTGELAGVFDHEWGHGMDDNDIEGSVSSPGEGIADIYAALRLNDSCVGRGFLGGNCSGYGDGCVDCSGVRDIDWAQRNSGAPHDITWADANCGSGSGQPCGGSTHCEGAVYSEAVWDLWNRDLQGFGGSAFNWTSRRAQELTQHLNFVAAGLVSSWFTCTNGEGGCAATTGYQQYLAADDDNGNIADGTPHMSALFAAFDRHGAACTAATVTDFGCVGTPSVASTLTVTPADKGASLSWTAAFSSVSAYEIFRTEGVFGCDMGRVKVATVDGATLSYFDNGLQNGREYYYTVIPKGTSGSCFAPASTCQSVTPAAGANLGINPSFTVDIGNSLGDGDQFVDNCEEVTVTLEAQNLGTGNLTNTRITGVSSASHPGVVPSVPAHPGGAIGACGGVNLGFDFVASTLANGDTLTFDVDFTADELAGATRSIQIAIQNVESDVSALMDKTWTYEANMEDWTVAEGTFIRTNANGGGADGTSFYLQSSDSLNEQCDRVHSPSFIPTAATTLSLYNRFDIEAFGGQWWDRANVGLLDADGVRTTVAPDGGRAYNASGVGGVCGTANQGGWADTMDSWAESTFSTTALGSSGISGQLTALAVNYGTDPLENGFGFRFDEVTVSNVKLVVPDAMAVCGSLDIFADGFESGDTTAWSATQP